MPPRLFSRRPTLRAIGELFVVRLRLLGVGAGEHPVPVALGEHRGLEVHGSECPRVAQRLGELERALDVLARGLVVALAAVAPRAPGEYVQAQLVGREGPSARPSTSASLKRLTAVEMLESMYRQTPRR